MIAIPNMSKPKSCNECESFYIKFYMGENKMGSACTLNDDDGSTIEADYNSCPLIEIVTCGECKYYEKSEYIKEDMVCKYHIGHTYYTEADRFCCYGERKE